MGKFDKYDGLDHWHRSFKGPVDSKWLLTNDVAKKLTDAIDKKLKAVIVYSGGSEPPTKRTIEPYKIFKRIDNNYLESYCYLRGELRTFRIDRITSIEILNEPQERYSISHTTLSTHTYTAPTTEQRAHKMPAWILIVGLFLLLYLCHK